MLHRSAPKTAKPPIKPKTFQLAINYRSHAGIIDFAQTVIHIITKFWPDSIDILKEEKGDNEGVKPIVFTGWTENSIPFEQHLFGDRLVSNTVIKPGAYPAPVIIKLSLAQTNVTQLFSNT